MDLNSKTWQDKISNHQQLGGIETSVLDNGLGRGVRIAWINTGTGLRYKLVLDRAMDIAEAFYQEHSLAWISHLGISPPQPFAGRGLDWLRTFGGGLLVTCGLSHIGRPETDEYGDRGLHGLISNVPAEIVSIIQPDPTNGKMDMSITGIIRETKIFGPSMELRRTISGTLGEASIRIKDEVINVGNMPTPHMILYHFNFGWPLADEGTDILWKGSWQSISGETNSKVLRVCPPTQPQHAGAGEYVTFIDPTANQDGNCYCGLHNPKLGLAVSLQFNKKQLPSLTNWQHWGKGEYVTGLEPGTNPPAGQSRARALNKLILLSPGEKRMYDLELSVLNDQKRIIKFLEENKFS